MQVNKLSGVSFGAKVVMNEELKSRMTERQIEKVEKLVKPIESVDTFEFTTRECTLESSRKGVCKKVLVALRMKDGDEYRNYRIEAPIEQSKADKLCRMLIKETIKDFNLS